MSAFVVWATGVVILFVCLVICAALFEEWKNPK